MKNRITISVLDTSGDGPTAKTLCARVSTRLYDRYETIARRTNRTRSDVVKLVLAQAIDWVEVTSDEPAGL